MRVVMALGGGTPGLSGIGAEPTIVISSPVLTACT
jgi:hypothetical protein